MEFELWTKKRTQGFGVDLFKGDKISNCWLPQKGQPQWKESHLIRALQMRTNVLPSSITREDAMFLRGLMESVGWASGGPPSGRLSQRSGLLSPLLTEAKCSRPRPGLALRACMYPSHSPVLMTVVVTGFGHVVQRDACEVPIANHRILSVVPVTGGSKVTVLAYADDLVMFSDAWEGMGMNMCILEAHRQKDGKWGVLDLIFVNGFTLLVVDVTVRYDGSAAWLETGRKEKADPFRVF
ncbi:unnamed protein product [Merluccius merluccius]